MHLKINNLFKIKQGSNGCKIKTNVVSKIANVLLITIYVLILNYKNKIFYKFNKLKNKLNNM